MNRGQWIFWLTNHAVLQNCEGMRWNSIRRNSFAHPINSLLSPFQLRFQSSSKHRIWLAFRRCILVHQRIKILHNNLHMLIACRFDLRLQSVRDLSKFITTKWVYFAEKSLTSKTALDSWFASSVNTTTCAERLAWVVYAKHSLWAHWIDSPKSWAQWE